MKVFPLALPRMLALVLLAGVLMRLPFLPLSGFEQDFLFFSSWATHLAEGSVISIYDDPEALSVGFINYPPVYLYILMVLARVYRFLFEGPLETTTFLVMIKSTTVLFELAISVMLYRWFARTDGEQKGAKAAALYFLNPAVLYVSAYYGQVDALFTGLIFGSVLALVYKRWLLCGGLMAVALLCKLQTLPFVPLLFAVPLLRAQWGGLVKMALGFGTAALVLLLPFVLYGRLDELVHHSVFASIEWGKYLSVGAFNLWYLHADPYTLDKRFWGWLYGGDGQLQAFAGVGLLRYNLLGVGLFGCAFLMSLGRVWQSRNGKGLWLAFAHVALAFYLFPTKVHERYLYPFFLLYLPLALNDRVRQALFAGFSITYLINLNAICPLFGVVRPVEAIDTVTGVATAGVNLVLYAMFVGYEFVGPAWRFETKKVIQQAALTGTMVAVALIGARYYERLPEPDTQYLSALMPTYVQQDWPPVAGELPPGYRQLKKDLSTSDAVLRIDDTFFRYGLGAHAVSIVDYEIEPGFDYFESWVGVDYAAAAAHDDIPSRGTVMFEVWVNGERKYESSLMIPTMPAEHVVVVLPEHEDVITLRLVVRDGGDVAEKTHSDHANWGLARVVKE